ncbi:DUF6207 family protein [Streptomyces prasinopilosus]|uniref:DUF6207 family protein n=1 Tax=Streptomyces prasinopilosus TaxID=67344 RepID=UPI003467C098
MRCRESHLLDGLREDVPLDVHARLNADRTVEPSAVPAPVRPAGSPAPPQRALHRRRPEDGRTPRPSCRLPAHLKDGLPHSARDTPSGRPRRHLHPAAVVHAAPGSPGFPRSPAVVEIAAADDETAPAVQELPAAPCDRTAAPCDRTGGPYEPGARRARCTAALLPGLAPRSWRRERPARFH